MKLREEAFTLLEVILAIAIFGMVVVSFNSYWVNSTQTLELINSKMVGEALAKDSIQALRGGSATLGINDSFGEKLRQIAIEQSGPTSINGVEFNRELTIEDHQGGIKRIEVAVSWQGGSFSWEGFISDKREGEYILSLNSSDEYIELTGGIGNRINQANSFTVGYWINYKEFPTDDLVLGDEREESPTLVISHNQGDQRVMRLSFTDKEGEVKNLSTGVDLLNDRWYFVAYTFDGSGAKAFLDGQERVNRDFGDLQLDIPQGLSLFKGYLGSRSVSINRLSIWDKALSQAEIQSQMSDGTNLDQAGLIAYYSFQEGGGDYIYDYRGGYHGLRYGGQWSRVVGF